MKKLSPAKVCLSLLVGVFMPAVSGYAGFDTTVPVSAQTATNIARSLFPVSLKSGAGNLYLTDPVVIFIDDKRIGLQAHLQAYDHRPEQGIAISEEGDAVVSGEVGFDPQTRQILLYNPKIDRLAFVNESAVTKRLRADVQAAWEAQVTNPIRAELPPHPFITPFKDGIQGVTYVNGSIFVQVGYLKVSGN